MERTDYIENRLKDQIKWYSKKSNLNKKVNLWIQTSIIILASIIPLLSGFTNELGQFSILIIGILGALVTILSGILALNKFNDKWTNYRNIAEYLKYELYLFETSTPPYHEVDTSFITLVQKVEDIIKHENISWTNYMFNNQED